MTSTRPHTKEGFYKKHESVYDEHDDGYLSPANAVLYYKTTNRDGYKMYARTRPSAELIRSGPNGQRVGMKQKRCSRHVLG
ncbi:hypothetical protein J27TS7_25200 [Paenibacillus dendritiformis]|nr:hypothetical protein J27TS7_25200 [Paenibacillus dendritiformis]